MTRLQFLTLATLFQGGLLLLGILIGVWSGASFNVAWGVTAIIRGLLATIPMLIFFRWVMKSHWKIFQDLRELLVKQLGPLLVPCSKLDMIYISLLAGVSEEVLFRGAIQNSLSPWGMWTAILATSLIFGLCHAATLIYFLYATGAGLYLSWVAGFSAQNLPPAIITHAVYDLIALLVVQNLAVKVSSVEAPLNSPSTGESPDTTASDSDLTPQNE